MSHCICMVDDITNDGDMGRYLVLFKRIWPTLGGVYIRRWMLSWSKDRRRRQAIK